ncbi:MAG: hypothetical protein OYH77_05990, partial [Pseudomonadota bacterium]|nr:hypothetical protein [Pseudomonadota bacterium]
MLTKQIKQTANLYLAVLFVSSIAFLCGNDTFARDKTERTRATAQRLTKEWDALVSKHVDARGGVSYLGFTADRKRLQAFLAQHRQLDVASFAANSKKSLYINLYNA